MPFKRSADGFELSTLTWSRQSAEDSYEFHEILDNSDSVKPANSCPLASYILHPTALPLFYCSIMARPADMGDPS